MTNSVQLVAAIPRLLRACAQAAAAWQTRDCITALVIFSVMAVTAPLAGSGEPTLVGIAVYPPQIHLSSAQDRQTLVVQSTYADGITRDVTSKATMSIAQPDRALVEGCLIKPLANGDTALTVAFADRSVTVPVHVERAGEMVPISFKLDVMPVFMKAGCNTGSCHGAARGKDGFRLSLFGFDPDGDYHRLTREISGRRLNLALVEESLLIEKTTNVVPHSGGAKIKKGDEHYATLIRWLEASG